MNKKRSHIILIWIIGFMLLSGCATTPPPGGGIINRTLPATTPAGQTNEAIKSYHYGGLGIDSGMSLKCNSDGSCLLFGDTYGSFGWSFDYLAVKISSDQNIAWAKTYDGSGTDRGLKAVNTSDGGFLLVGVSKSMLFTSLKSNKPCYPLIIKTDPNGNMQWAKAVEYYEVSVSSRDFYIYSAIQTSDGGYVIAGYYEGSDNKTATLLFKLSESGEFLWANYYGPSNGLEVYQFRVIETSDQKLAVLFGAKDKFGLFVTNHHGNPLWSKMFAVEDTVRIWPESLTTTQDSSFVIAASNLFSKENAGQAGAVILKLNPEGALVWRHQYFAGDITYAYDIIRGSNNNFLISGFTGTGALVYLTGGGNIEYPVKGFALLIDEAGREKALMLSDVGTGFRSSSKNQDKYLLFGDIKIAEKNSEWLLSVWQPQKENIFDIGKTIFSRRPIKMNEEKILIESKPIRLDIRDIKQYLKVHDLIVKNEP